MVGMAGYDEFTEADARVAEAQLGRPVRGVAGVAWRCPCGKPGVLATQPRLPGGPPFPTTYYLTCPRAVAECSRLEASGIMTEMTAWLEQDADLAARYQAAHQAYLADRAELAAQIDDEVPEIAGISAGGMPTRVKCLHALVGHALAASPGVNPIGDEALEMIGEFWRDPCLPGEVAEVPAEPETLAEVRAEGSPRSRAASEDEIVAALDAGTNTLRLLIVGLDDEGRLHEYARELRFVGLGHGVDATGRLDPESIARAWAAIEEYLPLIERHGAMSGRFVATSASRDAENRAEFFDGVRERLGIEAELISGDEEAQLSFVGALSGARIEAEPVLVMDSGGGSTELVRGDASGTIELANSIDIGSRRVKERYLLDDPPTAAQVDAARAEVNRLLDACPVDLSGIGTFVGVAGTVTSLAALNLGLTSYDRTQVHGSVMTPAEVAGLADRLLGMTATADQIAASGPVAPERAKVLVSGALVVAEVAKRSGRPAGQRIRHPGRHRRYRCCGTGRVSPWRYETGPS